MKKPILFVLAMVLLGVVGLFYYKNSKPTIGEGKPTVAIGILLPLTGDASAYGQKGKQAIELAIDDFNALDSVSGWKVSAVFEDSRGSAKDGVSAAQKLITVDKVPAIVGDALSTVTLPVAAVAESNQVVLMSPCSSAPGLTQAGKFIYRIWPSDLAEGKAAAEYASTHGYKNAAILHLSNDYGTGIADIFSKHFVGEGRHVVFRSGYADNTIDWRPVMTPLAAKKPDVIYIAGYYKDTAALLRAAAELGINAQFIGATAIEDENLVKLAGQAADGIVYPLATGFDPTSGDPKSRVFADAFKKRFGTEPGWMEAHAYDSFMLICEAIKNAKGPINGEAIRQYLDHVGTYHGVTGEIRFDENGDVLRGVVMKTVKDGQFVRLEQQP